MLTAERIPSRGPSNDGLHRFRIRFGDCQGLCFITTGEAQHLHQLTPDWVARAVSNRAAAHGLETVKQFALTPPGLMLHHSDGIDGAPSTRQH